MESSRIKIFESFPLVSVVMVYYGYTHEMFVVLSSLSMKIRMNMLKHYKNFRRIMLKYSQEMRIERNVELSCIRLPFDLFKLNIDKDYFIKSSEV